MTDLNLAQLQAFRTVVESGTLDAAALELHITPSAVSQRIKALESSVGRVLLRRTKPVQTTESGEAILLLARQMNELVDDALRRLDQVERSNIPLAINADSLATWVMPALAKVSHIATFEIFREDEARTSTLLRNGMVMAAITSEVEPVQGCRSIRLGVMRYRPMATQAFIDEWFPTGLTSSALAAAPVICFDRHDLLQDRFIRRHTKRAASAPKHFIPSTIEYGNAVMSGMGWGLIPLSQRLPNSSLIDLEPGTTIDVKLYWQQWQLASERLDAIARAVRDEARRALA